MCSAKWGRRNQTNHEDKFFTWTVLQGQLTFWFSITGQSMSNQPSYFDGMFFGSPRYLPFMWFYQMNWRLNFKQSTLGNFTRTHSAGHVSFILHALHNLDTVLLLHGNEFPNVLFLKTEPQSIHALTSNCISRLQLNSCFNTWSWDKFNINEDVKDFNRKLFTTKSSYWLKKN